MGIIVSCVYTGLSAGPLLAGLMITHLGWRWIFYVSVPVELAALLLTIFKMKGEWADARGELFDWHGSVVYMVSMFCLIYGVSNLVKTDWAIWLIAGGICGLTGFVAFEYQSKSPIVNIKLILNNRVFAFSNLATMVNYAASFGITFFFSLYLQIVKGLTPQTTGFILIIQPVIQALFSPYFGKLSDRHSPAVIATLGMAICAVGLGICTTVDASSSLGVIFLILMIMGTGFAMFSSPNMTAVMGCVEPRFYGVASSLIATMRSTGIMTSMTIITIIFSLLMGEHQVTPETTDLFIKSMTYAMYIFCLLSIIGICFSAVRTKNNRDQMPD